MNKNYVGEPDACFPQQAESHTTPVSQERQGACVLRSIPRQQFCVRILSNYQIFEAALVAAKRKQDAMEQFYGLRASQNQNERKAIAVHAQRLRALYAKSKDSQPG